MGSPLWIFWRKFMNQLLQNSKGGTPWNQENQNCSRSSILAVVNPMGTQSVHVKFRKNSLLGRLKTSGAPITKTKLTMSFGFFSLKKKTNLQRGSMSWSSDAIFVIWRELLIIQKWTGTCFPCNFGRRIRFRGQIGDPGCPRGEKLQKTDFFTPENGVFSPKMLI